MLATISAERRLRDDHRTGSGATVSSHPPAGMPQAPRTVQETGLPLSFLVELISKILCMRGQLKLAELSSHIKLNVSVLNVVMDFLRAERLCDITRRGGSGTDADLSYKLTELGQARAAEFRRNNAYAGPAPVPLAQYCAQVAAQSLAQLNILHADVEREFADIVVDAAVMDQLGSALNSHRAMLIYGPSGSGKTYLAESLGKLLSDGIFVPHAILAHGEVLQIHDPFVHQLAPAMAPAADLLARTNRHDERWLLCKRPVITAGRELTLAMLDLQFDPALRYYQLPLHLKANNGIFIIDDLGTHACSATELMDHWNAPFKRHVDHVSLHTGHKFPIPFDVIVVFTSNLQPEHLGDDAFLRRLGNRIHLGPLSESQYERIFRQVCEQYEIAYSSAAFHYLLHECHYKHGRPLLACHPRDILTQVCDLARYQGKPASLDPKSLDQAWTHCFNWS
jgi:predicted ATPase with chaperone activity